MAGLQLGVCVFLAAWLAPHALADPFSSIWPVENTVMYRDFDVITFRDASISGDSSFRPQIAIRNAITRSSYPSINLYRNVAGENLWTTTVKGFDSVDGTIFQWRTLTRTCPLIFCFSWSEWRTFTAVSEAPGRTLVTVETDDGDTFVSIRQGSLDGPEVLFGSERQVGAFLKSGTYFAVAIGADETSFSIYVNSQRLYTGRVVDGPRQFRVDVPIPTDAPNPPPQTPLPTSPPPVSSPTPLPTPAPAPLPPLCDSSPSRFNICLDFDAGPAYQMLLADFAWAKQKWEEVIVGDNGFSVPISQLDRPLSPNERGSSLPNVIDDIYVHVQVESIDGIGGTLGFAGPTRWVSRNDRTFAVAGSMTLDGDDLRELDRDTRLSTILHEMGHILGIGTLWGMNGLYPVCTQRILWFCYAFGYGGIAANDAYGRGSVPIELDGGAGTRGGHWDDGCLRNELMTGFIGRGLEPLSLITVAAMKDLGYQVNYNAADPYDIPNCGSFRRHLGASDRRELDADEEEECENYGQMVLAERLVGSTGPNDVNDPGASFVEVLYIDKESNIHLYPVGDLPSQ